MGRRAKKGSLQTPTLVIKGTAKEGKRKREQSRQRGERGSAQEAQITEREPGPPKGDVWPQGEQKIHRGVVKSQNLHL